jgi:Flp pilus assembly protein TadG
MSILTSSELETVGAPKGILIRAKSAISQFASDRRGDVAVIFGLMAIMMFLMVGGAVDIGRWLHARGDTVAALDAAVLAGGRALQLNGDEQAAITAAQRFYNENKKNRLTLSSSTGGDNGDADTITFLVSGDGTEFTAQGAAYIGTPFLSLMGIKALPLLKLTGSEYSTAKLAVGGNAKTNIEISMMLDVSGSMDSNNKFEDMQEAAKDLINIVVWEDQSEYTSKVAIVPFSADIRLSSAMLNAVSNPSAPSTIAGQTYSCKVRGVWTTCPAPTFRRQECVVERIGTDKYTAAGPAAGRYITRKYANVSNSTAGCSTPTASSVMPLTNDKTALINKINAMTTGGGTAGQLGTAWAWYMLSPDWSTTLTAAAGAVSAPKPYSTFNLLKIAILMTDGEYNNQYTAQGILTGTTGNVNGSTAANASSNTQARELCNEMKKKDITVYTVGFDLGGNQTAINTMNYCATSPSHAYTADNGNELKQAFRDIALKISALYISR